MKTDPNYNRVIDNRYRLLDLIGVGAMGQVYRAEDTLLGGVNVALKFLSQTLLSQKMRERFEREAQISALLGEKSIHIVRVKDYGIDDLNIPFYVMEFLQGENLSDLLKYNPLPLSRFFKIARQIGLGLSSAHEGIVFQNQPSPIVHRDIKPSNIFVVPDASLGELVKVLDFGIAKLLRGGDSQTHSFMGTLAYCSPEQMEGKELDNRSDIYSFGVMMYEMLTNEMPIVPETSSFHGWYRAHHEFPAKGFDPLIHLPEELESLVYQCLSKRPEHRPQNTAEILAVLERLERQISDRSTAPGQALNEEAKLKVAEDTTQVDASNRTTEVQTVFQDALTGASDPRSLSSITDFCLQNTWPQDKPREKIVFPRILTLPNHTIASLWAMLEQDDILNRKNSTRYNQFLCLQAPHPMLLWITVLYSSLYGPRWLPCYLDLQTDLGQRIIRTLAQLGSYRILLFSLEKPESCQYVLSATIAADQCKLFTKWADSSLKFPKSSNQRASKDLLQRELGKLKPKILKKLETVRLTP
ncbi:MAG: serine/threonine protein kinase [Chloroflexaceae bacterium]|nr:serine/threonine protein kinase [Chloroflexaceae bacterium]